MAEDEPTQARIVWPEAGLWPQSGYANVILAGHTPWDFTIRLGHVTNPPFAPGQAPPPGYEVQVTPVAEITMPPQALRQLTIILQDQIAKYTANFGEIGGGPPDVGISG